MKILLRIILSILTLIVIFFMIITGVFIVNKKFDRVTYIGNFTSFVSAGASMYPNIKPDNFLIIKKDNNYLLNDIITFKNDENHVVTHRIIKIIDNRYITKGDNNNFTDGYAVKNEDIYGKVIWIIPGLSTLLQYKYYIIAFIISVPIALFIIKRGKNVR